MLGRRGRRRRDLEGVSETLSDDALLEWGKTLGEHADELGRLPDPQFDADHPEPEADGAVTSEENEPQPPPRRRSTPLRARPPRRRSEPLRAPTQSSRPMLRLRGGQRPATRRRSEDAPPDG